MAWASNGRVRIHWQELGQGEPVLLIMGHLYTGDMWYPLIPELSKKYRLIWFDNRGSGESGRARRTTVSDMAADARAVMDAAGVERAHVFGVSMGGGIAMQLALESPERVQSLLLGCTAIATRSYKRRGRISNLRYFLPRSLARNAMRQTLYGPVCPDDGRAERDVEVIMKMKFSRLGVIGQSDAIRRYDLPLDQAATISAPTLVLHGTADQAVPYEAGVQISATLPDATLVTYEGAGHNFLVAATDEVIEDVDKFLSEQTAITGA